MSRESVINSANVDKLSTSKLMGLSPSAMQDGIACVLESVEGTSPYHFASLCSLEFGLKLLDVLGVSLGEFERATESLEFPTATIDLQDGDSCLISIKQMESKVNQYAVRVVNEQGGDVDVQKVRDDVLGGKYSLLDVMGLYPVDDIAFSGYMSLIKTPAELIDYVKNEHLTKLALEYVTVACAAASEVAVS